MMAEFAYHRADLLKHEPLKQQLKALLELL